MGTTKRKTGDGHVIFHVGKELPEEGSNLMLVPGIQNAQGRGVYFADDVRMKYSGSEHFRKELHVTPIYAIPMVGEWIRGKNKKKGGEISFHSDGKILALFDLRSFDAEVEGQPVRYYYPRELSIFKEPDTQQKGRHITSELSDRVLSGVIEFDDAVTQLREQYKTSENRVNEEVILERMQEAIGQGRLPNSEQIVEKLTEIRMMREGSERMRRAS